MAFSDRIMVAEVSKVNGFFLRLTDRYFSGQKNTHYAFMVAAFFVSIFNVRKAIHCGQDTGCIDRYWINFWLTSYSDGYVRRGLLGQIVRFFFGDSISYFALNVIAFSSVIVILLIVFYSFFSKISDNKNWPLIFIVLVSGPASTIFFETLGDTLHIAMGVGIIYILFVDRFISSYCNSGGVGYFIVGCLVVLIHEASVFFVFPAFYLLYSLSAGKDPGYGPLVLLVMILSGGFVLLTVIEKPDSAGIALITKDAAEYFSTDYVPSSENHPSLSDVLLFELSYYVGSVDGLLGLVFKVLGAFFWPLLMLLAMGHILKNNACFKLFIYLLLPSFPLYFMAHDWGRFAIYTLCVSLVLFVRIPADRLVNLPRAVNCISDRAFSVTRTLFGSAASIIVLLLSFHSHDSYRMDGLSRQTVVLIVISAVAFMLNNLLSSRAECGEPVISGRNDSEPSG